MSYYGEPAGRGLRKLLNRSGLTQDELAQAMGYKRASSIQRYLEDGYGEDGGLKLELAAKFAKGLVGKGEPPVTNEEVFGLAGVTLTENGSFRASNIAGVMELGALDIPTDVDPKIAPVGITRSEVFQLPKDLPVYGTALGSSLEFISEDSNKVAIEQTNLSTGDVIEYLRRPPKLAGNREAHVLYLQGSSMEPKFEEGESILVDPRRPIRARDYVVVTLKRQEAHDIAPEAACVMVKRLVRRSSEFVDLEQFNPPAIFRVPMVKVLRISPVVPWGDAMGF